ncbi:MAG: dTDP-4-dehydrorhamnose 3,5-epimerase [Flavobacteriales bacterium]
MEAHHTHIEGLVLLHPRIFTDERGRFLETFNERRFTEVTGLDVRFVQDNESRSNAGVLRGLHFQLSPHAQGKLVHTVRGAVLDVCVDIRKDSPTFGQHFKVRLDAGSKVMLWIPPGFAHGFVALENDTVFVYKCTDYYDQPSERTILWDDPDLAIDWGVTDPVISEKDRRGFRFEANWAVPAER